LPEDGKQEVSFWIVQFTLGLLLISGVFGYTALKWRSAPKVFRAMNWVVSATLVAGFLLAVPTAHWARLLFFASPAQGASSAFGRLRDEIEGACPSDGVSASEVGKALVLADENHAGDPNWVSNEAQAELCKESAALMVSQLCAATFVARHVLGKDLQYGDHRSLIPCDEVAEFCDNGALDKNSSLCKEAYRTRNATLDRQQKRSAEGTKPAAAPSGVSEGIPFDDVHHAEELDAGKCGGGGLESWESFDEGCRLGNYDSGSLCCRAAHLFMHGASNNQPIPYREVAAFCNAGALRKESEVCKAANRLAGLSR
jgi:hypothetical protein